MLAPLPASGWAALAISAAPPPEGWTPEALPGHILADGATALVAAPTQLARLLALPPQALSSSRAVLATAEPLAPELRGAPEAAWGCPVLDHWGLTETGYGGGVECRAQCGYHLREADLLLEMADPESGRPLPPGQSGEILVATLGERAMPLIRCPTGDAATWLPGPCPCGSHLRRLGRVLGRMVPDAEAGRTVLNMPKGGARP